MDLTSLKQKSHKRIREISLFIIGVISSASILVWPVYFVEQSDLSVEIAEMKEWSLRNNIDDDQARHALQQVLSMTRDYTSMEFKEAEMPTINTPALVFLLSDVKDRASSL